MLLMAPEVEIMDANKYAFSIKYFHSYWWPRGRKRPPLLRYGAAGEGVLRPATPCCS